MTTDKTELGETVKETGFHSRTAQLTDDFVAYNGFWLANSYRLDDPLTEYWACRKHVSIMDLSPLRKFEVLGPDAETLLQYTLTRNIRRLAVGQVTYSAMCFEAGGMIDDGTVMRLGNDNFRWVGGSDLSGQWLQKQARELGLRVWVRPSTDRLHNLSIQGPSSRDVLKCIVWTPPLQPSITELSWYRLTIARIDDYAGIPIVVSRTGCTGELGYEIWCHPKHAGAVWDRIMQAGAAYEITPLGLAALDTLRIEAGLVFAGYEFDDDTSAFEAGLGFTVNLSDNVDFIGKQALSEFKSRPRKCLVGVVLEQTESAQPNAPIQIDGQSVGNITSGTFSPVLGKSIALGHIEPQHTRVGTRLSIAALSSDQADLSGEVAPLPFYDPGKKRVRS